MTTFDGIAECLKTALDSPTLAVSPQDELRKLAAMDSMRLVHFAVAVEKRFRVRFPTRVLLSFVTVADVQAAVEELQRGN